MRRLEPPPLAANLPPQYPGDFELPVLPRLRPINGNRKRPPLSTSGTTASRITPQALLCSNSNDGPQPRGGGKGDASGEHPAHARLLRGVLGGPIDVVGGYEVDMRRPPVFRDPVQRAHAEEFRQHLELQLVHRQVHQSHEPEGTTPGVG